MATRIVVEFGSSRSIEELQAAIRAWDKQHLHNKLAVDVDGEVTPMDIVAAYLDELVDNDMWHAVIEFEET